ncbi:MAG: DEAD/DEAH box helicase [Candidatus Hydrogenedentes bacterium]|nr:DEAD/DEAH box helicase [Candidatus Hydrogenedentota bacterium]
MKAPSDYMTFDDFGLDPRCLRVLHEQQIITPTPVQAQAMPIALAGRDVIAVAQTGTGKTLAFSLPALTRLASEHNTRNQMLVLTPTRELAVQVERVIQILAKSLHMHSAAIYGGVGMDKQTQDLKRGREIIVATPGRLLDHMGRGNVAFPQLRILVLDEADRMLDMGFLPDIRRILRQLPRERQTMMFSATFPDEIARLTSEMMNEPERISVGLIARPVDSVRQLMYPVMPEDKARLLLKILEEQNITSAVIFLRTKDRTERIGTMLHKKGYKAACIHGDRSQRLREQALDGFRKGRYSILVATDVAARGLDIEGITHVINYDIPPTAEDYIHRIGRTARAQAEGDAITFVSPAEHTALETIERALGRNLPRSEWDGAPPVLSLYQSKEDAKPKPGPRRPARRLLRRR